MTDLLKKSPRHASRARAVSAPMIALCALMAVATRSAAVEATSPPKPNVATRAVGDKAVVPAASATTADPETEVQRFCSNIADAARDRRYALQAQELEALRADIDKRMQALEKKRLEYEGWLKRRNDFLASAEESVVKIYARMKPDAAAERLAEVSPELAAAILMKLDSRQAGVILNEMERTAAATLTGIIASASRKVDPT